MNKIFLFLSTVLMLVALASCGGDEPENTKVLKWNEFPIPGEYVEDWYELFFKGGYMFDIRSEGGTYTFTLADKDLIRQCKESGDVFLRSLNWKYAQSVDSKSYMMPIPLESDMYRIKAFVDGVENENGGGDTIEITIKPNTEKAVRLISFQWEMYYVKRSGEYISLFVPPLLFRQAAAQ